MKKYLIAGGGVAAAEAANALRGLDPESEITIFSRENVLPYRRPALPRALAADLPDTQFLLKPASFYEEKKIAVELGVEVVAIDRANQTIRLDHGEVKRYDALLLALGGSCFRPPIPGIHGDRTVVLHDWCDTLHLRRLIASGKKKIQTFLKETTPDHSSDIIESMWSGKLKKFYINTKNNGAVTNLQDDAYVEIPCVADMNGVRALPFGPIPRPISGFMQRILDEHELAVEAAVTFDRKTLLQAFLASMVTVSIPDARICMEQMLAAEKKFLPKEWFK